MGAIAWITISALVVVLIIFLAVAVLAVIAGWKRWSNSGTFDLKTDVSGKSSIQTPYVAL